MYRKFSIGFIIFISAFMLNVSAMSFQLRYERKEDDKENNPFVIEMTDQQVFKFLKNTWFFDLPLMKAEPKITSWFINDDLGFGNQYEVTFKPFLTCQLKFLLIDYIGVYSNRRVGRTYSFMSESLI